MDTTKLIVAFRNFANAPKNGYTLTLLQRSEECCIEIVTLSS